MILVFLKPDKEIFNEIEKFTENKPNEILMVGDSFKSDIVGAKNMKWNYLKINRYTSISNKYEIKDLNGIRKHIYDHIGSDPILRCSISQEKGNQKGQGS